jgi:outer membrane receptor protein involved in Fe transport
MIMLVAAGPALAQSAGPAELLDPSSATPGVSSTTEAPALEASAESAVAIDQLTLGDDLIGAIGWRPLGNRRGELVLSTGTDATHHAAARASDTLGSVGIELTGTWITSDVVAEQSAASARIEHATESDRARIHAGYGTTHVGLTRQSFVTEGSAATYGVAWTAWRSAGRLELEADGEQTALRDDHSAGTLELDGSRHRAHAGFTSRRVSMLELDHAFAADVDVVQASGTSEGAIDDGHMATHMQTPPRAKRGRHRFLSAYIHDTVRVIQSLDVHGGFVFEHWSWLSNMPPLSTRDAGDPMDLDSHDMITELLMGPRFGASYRVAPTLSLDATAYRHLRAPAWQQLMRPVQNGDVWTVPGELRAETVTGGQVGPTLSRGRLDARAVVYWNEVDAPITAVTVADTLHATTNLGHARETGVAASASWRPAKPLLAGIDYTFSRARVTDAGDVPQLAGTQLAHTPRHRAALRVAYDRPRCVTLSGAVRYVGSRYEDDRNTIVAPPFAVVDAMAARKLTRGLAGFVSIENVLDRRYVAHVAGIDTIGAPRLVQVGVRLDSGR